jgi:low affinity Fe/Cu permease
MSDLPTGLSPRFEWFRRFAQAIARALGAPWAFAGALVLVLGWGVAGPVFHFSNGWQLLINTSTTIMTFLMVFVIQNTQNRDSQVTQLKLDELIRAVRPARNELVHMEGLSDDELLTLQHQFEELRVRAEAHRASRRRVGERELDATRGVLPADRAEFPRSEPD